MPPTVLRDGPLAGGAMPRGTRAPSCSRWRPHLREHRRLRGRPPGLAPHPVAAGATAPLRRCAAPGASRRRYRDGVPCLCWLLPVPWVVSMRHCRAIDVETPSSASLVRTIQQVATPANHQTTRPSRRRPGNRAGECPRADEGADVDCTAIGVEGGEGPAPGPEEVTPRCCSAAPTARVRSARTRLCRCRRVTSPGMRGRCPRSACVSVHVHPRDTDGRESLDPGTVGAVTSAIRDAAPRNGNRCHDRPLGRARPWRPRRNHRTVGPVACAGPPRRRLGQRP